MKYAIDRFEGEYAVIVDDNEKTFLIPKELVKNYQENDIIMIVKDEEETIKRKERITNMMNKLFED